MDADELSFHQARPAKWSYEDMDMVAEPAKAPATTRSSSQNQDHILAERKRHEKLNQRFITISKIVLASRRYK